MHRSRLGRVLAAAVIAALVHIGGAAAPAQAEETATLSGRIWIGDFRTPAGAGEVTITLRPAIGDHPISHSAVTDAQGRYEIAGIPFTAYRIVIHDTLGRYPDLEEELNGFVVGGTTGLDWTFGADGRIVGTMRAADGSPLAGQAVLYRHDVGGTGNLQRQGIGPNGAYEFWRLPLSSDFTWTLEFIPDDPAYAPQYWQSRTMHQTPTILLADDLLADVQYDSALPLAASIAGTIGGDVAPADFAAERVDVEVLVLDDAGTTWIATGHRYTVGPDGSYGVPRMSPGSYRLRVVWGVGGGVSRVDTPVIDLDPAEEAVVDVTMTTPGYTRDLSGDGFPDILARNSAGKLLSYPLTPATFAPHIGTPRVIGSGWQSMTALLRAGDFSGDGRDDVIARDATGYLWLYKGTASGTLTGKVKIGSGFKTYTALFSPGDFNGDGTSDMIARDAAGTLFLYPGNGAGRFLSRVKIGTGWKGFTALLGPGDFDDDGASDIIVRDAAGTIWLYPGNGTGGVTARVKVATGWKGYTAVFSVGDVDGDRRPDLIARDSAGWLWEYSSVDLATGLTPTFRKLISTGWKPYSFVR